jgi:hypothetical protein
MDAGSTQQVYRQYAEETIAGTIYIRGKIRLLSGAFVYTDIIPVFTSGPKNILFYPNPAMNGQPVSYVMKQGVSPDCRLQIFDLYGRKLKEYASLPRSVSTTGMSRGTYFFKVTDHAGNLLAVEKMIIP